MDQPGSRRGHLLGALRRTAGSVVSAPRIAVVVGNPKPRSRTHEAALSLADRLGGADLVVDLADVAGELFDWSSSLVSGL
ncbi:hypothetical protein Q0O77_14855, partial [Staphylococcus aureus]|nr:hypothetical protein [Staphylococcus aureus]